LAQKPAFAARVRQRGGSRAGAKVSLLARPGVGLTTIQRIEQSKGVVKGKTVVKIQNALE
jgi:hypothetical protein